MAAGVISAIQEKYDSLTFPNRPTQLWFGQAPLTDKDGLDVQLPIIQLYHDAATQVTTFEYPSIETWAFHFEAYAATLDDVEALAKGVLFDQLPPENVAGLAYTQSLPLPPHYKFEQFTVRSLPLYARVTQQRAADASAAFSATWQMLLEVYYIGWPPPD